MTNQVVDSCGCEDARTDDDAGNDQCDRPQDREVVVSQVEEARDDRQQDRGQEGGGEGRLLLRRVLQEAIHQSAPTAAIAAALSRSRSAVTASKQSVAAGLERTFLIRAPAT